MAKKKTDELNFYQQVFYIVRRIPRGKVAAYGWIATWLGRPRAARAVGYAMAAAPDDVPWQRVINSKGEISVGGAVWRPDEQIRLLHKEGVTFSKAGQTDLRRFGFRPSAKQLQSWSS